jgi:hypothetical protein
MARRTDCDICGKPTNRVVAKIYLSPAGENGKSQMWRQDYTAHADVGECCASQIIPKTKIRWQPRKKRDKKTA